MTHTFLWGHFRATKCEALYQASTKWEQRFDSKITVARILFDLNPISTGVSDPDLPPQNKFCMVWFL